MRKLWLLIVLGLSWWGMRASTVFAEVSYDPAQGGVFWEPPAEMSISLKNLNQTTEFIPFGYAPPGDLSPDTIKKIAITEESYKIQNGQAVPASLLMQHPDGYLGVSVQFKSEGDYRVDLHLKPDEDLQIDRTVIVHVTKEPDSRTLLPVPKQRLLSPLPVMFETTSSQGSYILKITNTIMPGDSDNNSMWTRGTLSTYILPTVLLDKGVLSISQLTQEYRFTLNGETQSRTLTYGLANIIATEGRPITLDALYLKPMPGTKLTFNWTYTANDQTQTVTSDTPSLPIPDNWHADGSIYVTLIYSYNDKSVAIKSNTVNYHYQPQVLRAASTFGVSDLLQRDIHVNARIADWPITQTGDWQLEVAVSPVQTISGVRMPAALILPGGTQVAGGETKRLAFSGDQVLALTQAEWLLQQQPTPVAGQYNATVRFTVISGPE